MKEKKLKIGILGGTFNPIHNGHLYLAGIAREAAGLDKVLFIPSGRSYMKDTSIILSAADRLNMVRLAIGGNEFYDISTIEIDREGNSYSCETIMDLQKKYPEAELYFIIGADTLFQMERWKLPDEIFHRAIILAAYRNGEKLDAFEQKMEELNRNYQADIRLIAADPVDISSTDVRNAVKSGRSLSAYVPAAVEAYITEHHFYQKERNK